MRVVCVFLMGCLRVGRRVEEGEKGQEGEEGKEGEEREEEQGVILLSSYLLSRLFSSAVKEKKSKE